MLRNLVQHRYVLRASVGLYVLCVFSLIASYFAVSTMDVEVSTYIQGSKRLRAGTQNAARGVVMNAPTGQLFVDAKTRFSVGSSTLAEAATQRHGHFHAELTPTDDLVGPRTVGVEIDHPAFDTWRTSAAVEIVRRDDTAFGWPIATTRKEQQKKTSAPEWEGELRARWLPTNAEVPRGLSSTVFLLVTDTHGTPAAATVFVEKIEGMLEGPAPVELRTDELGLVRLELNATTSQRWTLRLSAAGLEPGAPERAGSGALPLFTVPSQFSLRLLDGIAVPGQPLKGLMQSLHRSGGVLVDLYDPDDWVVAEAFGIAPGESGVQALVPDDVGADIVKLQVYQDLFDSGLAWDVKYAARAPSRDPQACVDALRRVLDLHARHDESMRDYARNVVSSGVLQGANAPKRCSRWLEAMLLAIPPHFDAAPLLVNSQVEDRQALDEWREETKGTLRAATTGVLLVGFAFVLLLVLQGMQRSQLHAAALREVELETIEDGDDLPTPGPNVEAWLTGLRVVIVILSIFTFGASLLMLLSWM